jgi:predicted DNA-binding ribbon-helix-helix protein
MKEKLASFRIDKELWEAFKAIASSRETTASCLLVDFIESVVSNRDCIDNSAVDR